MNYIKKLAGAFLIATTALTLNAQPLKLPAPSPLQTIKQSFGLGEVTLEYSRPSVKNRVVFGDLVPYGKVWRTGANATTKIVFTEDVKLEGNAVPAGTYGIYSVPNADSWDIMLYKDLTLGGNVADYKAENEVLKFKVKPTSLGSKVETMTFNFSDITATTAVIELLWDKVRVPINLTTEIDVKMMKNIETAMAMDRRPYFQAATYYYDNDKDMKQAFDWVNKAVDQNPKAYWVQHLKAKIQVKLKDYKGAVTTAESSMALAKEDKDDTYVKMNERLIAEAKKAK